MKEINGSATSFLQDYLVLAEENKILRKQNRRLRCCGNCAYLRYYPESIEEYDCAIRNLGEITSACEDWKMRRQR